MSHRTERVRLSPNAALGASAFVLAALVILAAGRPWVTPAAADMVVEHGGFVMMTAESGNDEVLLVLDNRAETLSVYRVENQNALEMYRRYDLPEIFTSARATALGRN